MYTIKYKPFTELIHFINSWVSVGKSLGAVHLGVLVWSVIGIPIFLISTSALSSQMLSEHYLPQKFSQIQVVEVQSDHCNDMLSMSAEGEGQNHYQSSPAKPMNANMCYVMCLAIMAIIPSQAINVFESVYSQPQSVEIFSSTSRLSQLYRPPIILS